MSSIPSAKPSQEYVPSQDQDLDTQERWVIPGGSFGTSVHDLGVGQAFGPEHESASIETGACMLCGDGDGN